MIQSTTNPNPVTSRPETLVLENIRMDNIWVELVPSKDWEARLKAGQEPRSFYSIRGHIEVNGRQHMAEVTIGAMGEEPGVIRAFDTARPTRDGRSLAVVATTGKSHCALIECDSVTGSPVLMDGEPLFLDTRLKLQKPWSWLHVVKSHVFVDNTKSVVFERLAVTLDGSPTLTARATGTMTVVDAPARISAGGAPLVLTPGAVGIAARRNAVSTPARVEQQA